MTFYLDAVNFLPTKTFVQDVLAKKVFVMNLPVVNDSDWLPLSRKATSSETCGQFGRSPKLLELLKRRNELLVAHLPSGKILRKGQGRADSRAGHAVVEVALMAPWIFLLFAMVFDIGFYCYAVIATQNAARSGVMHTSRSSSYVVDLTAACQIATRELRGLPNVSAALNTCAASAGAITDSLPIAVAVAAIAGPDATTLGAARVSVSYRSPQLFPLPGLMGRMTVTRIAEARVRDN